MTRALIATLLLAALAAAQEPQTLIRAQGETLEAFALEIDLSRIDRSSSKALAGSYAAFLVEQHNVGSRFAQLFRRGYRVILGRYYIPSIVALGASGKEGAELACTVSQVKEEGDRAVATLDHVWKAAGAEKAVSRILQLHLDRRDGEWWVGKIMREEPGKGFEPRPLQVPPTVPDEPVPDRVVPDRSSAEDTVRSLKKEMLRLRALTQKGRKKLDAGLFRILHAFHGKKAVKKALKERPQGQPRLAHSFYVRDGSPLQGGRVRVDVLAMEKIPGTDAQESAVGRATFDLKKGDDGFWTIEREMMQPRVDRPPQVLRSNFALFFVG